MKVIFFFLIAIFGFDVEGVKIRAIRRRVIQYLPTDRPEAPSQTQYNWKQWRSPVYKNGRLIYSYDGTNGIKYNVIGGGSATGSYGNRNYVNGRQIYQSAAQSGADVGGINEGQRLFGMKAEIANSEGVNGGKYLGHSEAYGENGIRIEPAIGQTLQNSVNGGQISLSTDLSGSHSAASAYSSQIAGRSNLNMINSGPISDNGEIIIIKENGENEGSTDNVVDIINVNNDENSEIVSLVNADSLDSENKEIVSSVNQSAVNGIDNTPLKNIIHGIEMNNEENSGLIDSVSGNGVISPDDGAIYTVDQTTLSSENETPLKDIADEINVKNKDMTSGSRYIPVQISPNNLPYVYRKPDLWSFNKFLFKNIMNQRNNHDENPKIFNDFPIDQQPTREYYDAWRQYISNRQTPTYFNYNTHPKYVDWTEKPTVENIYAPQENPRNPRICQNEHTNMLPEREEIYYGSGDIDGRPINKQDYIINKYLKRLNIHKVPKIINKNFKTPTNTDYVYEVNPDSDSISIDYLERGQEASYDTNKPQKNIIFNPQVKPDTPNEYIPMIYTPPAYGPSYSKLIPKEYDLNPVESSNNNFGPFNPFSKPNQDYIQTPSGFEQNYFPKPNEDILQSQQIIDSNVKDKGYDVTKVISGIPDSRFTYKNSNSVDQSIPAWTVPNKDALRIMGTTWGQNWNNTPRENISLKTITVEQYIRQITDALIPHLMRLYYSKCSVGHDAELLDRLNDIIGSIQYKYCETSPEY